MIYKGIYHLFYQWNPKGAVWGNIVWAHSTSTDLINWDPHPPAIFPSEPFDINGCWSGSATILPDGKPVILYTGIDPKNQQVQNIAEPKDLSDPYLVEWKKSPLNPLIAPDAVNGINASSFRDPTTAWLGHDKKWRVIIGSKIHRRGLAITYTSKDFLKWEKSPEPLHYDDGSGMWECPDFFPVTRFGSKGVETSSFGEPNEVLKHVLKISLDDTKHDYYTLGTYDRVGDKFVPDKGFKMALGLKGGLLITAHTKGKNYVDANGNSIYAKNYIQKESDKHFINSTRFALTGRIGYGHISIDGSYQVTSFLKTGAGPVIHPASIGLTLSGL